MLSFTCLVGLALFGTLSSGVNGADGRENVSNDLKSAVDKPFSTSKLDHSIRSRLPDMMTASRVAS